MRIQRNITNDGKCKYAIVRLDKLKELEQKIGPEASNILHRRDTDESIAHSCLRDLELLGLLEYGQSGTEEECFVLKLKDAYAPAALRAYAVRASEGDIDYAKDVLELAVRAKRHPNRRLPD